MARRALVIAAVLATAAASMLALASPPYPSHNIAYKRHALYGGVGEASEDASRTMSDTSTTEAPVRSSPRPSLSRGDAEYTTYTYEKKTRSGHSSSSLVYRTSAIADDTTGQTLIPVSKTDPGVYPGTPNGASKGWPFMPDLTSLANATLDTSTITVGDHGATLTHYISANYSANTAKRAVIMVHGDDRVSWNMQIYTNNALLRAVTGGGVDYNDVIVAAPQFFDTVDAGAYPTAAGSNASTDGALVWIGSWGDGSEADYPQDASVGAFDALDALTSFFLDKERFPALQNVVVGGFSMGAQLTQRYSVFRANTNDDDRLRFWVSSPASFVYFNSTRPAGVPKGCRGYNMYKYGLDGVLPSYVQRSNTNVADLVSRYVGRTLNFFVGTSDYIAGDTRCQADAQGINHVAKMYYWVTAVMPFLGSAATGQLPTKSTIDYVEGIGHDPWNIINSDPGVQRLFLDDYNGDGQSAAAPPSNGIKSGEPTSKDLHRHSNSARSLFRGDSQALLVAFAAVSALVSVLFI